MDPQVTLDQAARFIKTGANTANESRSQEAFREAGDKLQDYWEWRNRQGFEPTGGDARAHQLANDLSDAWEKREREDARDRDVHEDQYANPGENIPDLADVDPRASHWKTTHGKVRQYHVVYLTGDQMVSITKKVTGPEAHQTIVEEKYLIPLDKREYLKVVREVQRKHGKTGQKAERAAYEKFKRQYAAVRTANPDPEGEPFPVYPDMFYIKSKKTGRIIGGPQDRDSAKRIAKKYGKGYSVVPGTKVKPEDLEALEIDWMEADTLGKSRHYHYQDEFEHDGSFEYVAYGSQRELTEMYDKGLVRKPRARRRPHGPSGTHVAIVTPDGGEAIPQWRNRPRDNNPAPEQSTKKLKSKLLR